MRRSNRNWSLRRTSGSVHCVQAPRSVQTGRGKLLHLQGYLVSCTPTTTNITCQ